MKNGVHADLPSQLAAIATEPTRVPPTGSPVHALAGRSILPLLSVKADRIRGDWNIIWVERPFGIGGWELFNIAKDMGEQNNLAVANPKKLDEMMGEWKRYAEKYHVIIPGKLVPALER